MYSEFPGSTNGKQVLKGHVSQTGAMRESSSLYQFSTDRYNTFRTANAKLPITHNQAGPLFCAVAEVHNHLMEDKCL